MAIIKWDSECELEDYIYNSMSENKRNIATDEAISFIKRQFRIGSYGVADIITGESGISDGDPSIFTIIELKKEIIKPDAIAQIIRYKTGLACFLRSLGIEEFNIQCQLFAPIIDDDAVFLADEINGLSVHESRFDLSEGVLLLERCGITREAPCFNSEENILSETVDLTIKNKEIFKNFTKDSKKD